MQPCFTAVDAAAVNLRDPELLRRRAANREYLMSLSSVNLLLSYYLEAGINPPPPYSHKTRHGGWEDPAGQLRGHFLGHWLSAAALYYHTTGDPEVLGKANNIVSELKRCQRENGGEWAGPIPEKYLWRVAHGRPIWAPHYTLHKTLMGLLDMYELAASGDALAVLESWAPWFHRWAMSFKREKFDDILDVETGGMLEIWARLYALTKENIYCDLVERYTRGRLFEPLLNGDDVLTNMHANTTIPEALGAAAVFEATGDERFLRIAKAYWESAVTHRGYYATGGQTCGEIWTPPFKLAARLGDKNQEHCTVYNMNRLAEFLLRHTGEAQYADYIERNMYNGIMAQAYWKRSYSQTSNPGCPDDGLLTYFLPLKPGARKDWASHTGDFFCCHGTVVQANAALNEGVYYMADDGLVIAQYRASSLKAEWKGVNVSVDMAYQDYSGSRHLSSESSGKQYIGYMTAAYPDNPMRVRYDIRVETGTPTAFTLRLRVPWWARDGFRVAVDGHDVDTAADANGFLHISQTWSGSDVTVELPRRLYAEPLPDKPGMVAFMDGPVTLAGLCGDACELAYDGDPASLLVPDDEREWGNWMNAYRTTGQASSIRFIPLYKVGYEEYTVYFPVREKDQ